MPAQTTRSMLLEPRSRESSPRIRLSQLGQRIADVFRGVSELDDPAIASTDAFEALTAPAEAAPPRFPMSRSGYHCASVDEYVARLEDELAALDHELAAVRAQTETRDEVRTEIERIGEQTSAVLIAANEQRDAMLRAGREEADRLVTDARAEASRLTAEGEARLRGLKAEGDSIQRERDRLLEDARGVSVALAALVDGAQAGAAEPGRDQAT